MSYTLEQVDAALASSADLSVDDRALLWIARARILGLPIESAHLTLVMGLSADEAEDVFARLAEHGMIERDETAEC